MVRNAALESAFLDYDSRVLPMNELRFWKFADTAFESVAIGYEPIELPIL